MKMFAVLTIAVCSLIQPLFPQFGTAQKLIVTVTDDWNSNKATVYLFDRSKDSWKMQRVTFSVSIGENGLAWGTGLHTEQQGDHIKQEGDRRSPAGMFELDTILYGMNTSAPEGVRFPYRQMTSMTRCIDDTASHYYNSIVEEGAVKKDWESAEEMNDVDPDYTYVLTVRNNAGQKKGKGSCIFFHINNVPTSGCTAMDEEDMLTLLHWLDPKRKTVIVQLPHEEYHRLRREWNLPKLINN
jgi:L,D-peptidoglycan transpeptidase YkuD (ErfK/YbiS/YcfS/YnhG family)